MKEIDGDPEEQTVADRYSADLELCVVRGSFIAPAPPGYDGDAEFLEYEGPGDRIRKEDVTLAEFASATNLTLLHTGGKVAAGAGIGGLSHNDDQQLREYGVAPGRGNYHPSEVEADADAGEQDRADSGEFVADAEGD